MLIPCDSQTSDRLHKKAKLEFPCSSQEVRREILLIVNPRNNSRQSNFLRNKLCLFSFSISEITKIWWGPDQGPKAPSTFLFRRP